MTETLLAHVVSVLEDDFARKAYGPVYTQILCKILEVSRSVKNNVRGIGGTMRGQ